MEATSSIIVDTPPEGGGRWIQARERRFPEGKLRSSGSWLASLSAPTFETFEKVFALTPRKLASFGLVSGTNPQNTRAGQLALAVGVALFAGMPMDWESWLAPGSTRVGAIGLRLGGLCLGGLCLGGLCLGGLCLGGLVLRALRSRLPAWGLCGSLAAAVGVGMISKGVVGLRIGTAVSWMTHAFVWTRVDGGVEKWMIPSAAVLILFLAFLVVLVSIERFTSNGSFDRSFAHSFGFCSGWLPGSGGHV